MTSIEAKFGPRVDGAEPTLTFLIEEEVRPIGWIQWYLWADYPDHARQIGAGPSSAGLDVAIGEPVKTGLGVGPVVIGEFIKRFVFVDPRICDIITDPEKANHRSLRAFEKAGFRRMQVVQLKGENSKRQVMRFDREQI